MTSSKGKPFLFDENIFDEDAPGGVRTKQKIVEDPPEFTKKQVEEIRNRAYQEGLEKGLQQGEENKSRMLIQIISNLEMHTKNIEHEEAKRKELYEAECLHLCFHALKKAFPVFHRTFGTEELGTLIADALTKYNTPETLQIEVSGTVLAEVKEIISQNTENVGKSLSFIENNSLADTEFHISWSQGGIIYNRATVLEKIMEIMEETLARKGINVHDEEANDVQTNENDSTDQENGSGENINE